MGRSTFLNKWTMSPKGKQSSTFLWSAFLYPLKQILRCLTHAFSVSLKSSRLQDKNSSFPFILRPSIPHLLGLPLSKVYLKMKVLVAQLCPALCDPMDCNPPGSSILGILHARILEWVAISFSRESSWPRDRTWVCNGRRILYCLSHLVKMSPRKL